MSARTDRGRQGRGQGRFARTLAERWWVILLIMVLFGVVGYAVSSFALQPRYSATAQLTYSQTDADTVSRALEDAGTAPLPKTLSNDALVIQTSAFAERVSQALGEPLRLEKLRSSVEASVKADVEAMSIRATAANAELAAAIANAYAEEFVLARQRKLQELLQSALDFVQGRIDSLTPSESSSGTRAELEQQRYALEKLMSRSLTDYQILERATVPASPYYPRPLLAVIYGLVAGLIVGFLLGLVLTSKDPRIRDRTTLERVMGLPILAPLPLRPAKQERGRIAIGLGKTGESLLESMKLLHSNLRLLGFGETKRTLLITSTNREPDRGVLAVDLTLSMALAGERVILVDADLHDPSIHKYLGLANDQGLGDALLDSEVAWADRIQPVDLAPHVDARLMSSETTDDSRPAVSKFLCLTSGARPDNPAQALESPALGMLLADLRGYSDYVIVSGPPLLPSSDSLAVARSVDAVILATSLGKQTVAEAKRTRQIIERSRVGALGLVLCGARTQDLETYRVSVVNEHDDADFVDDSDFSDDSDDSLG